MLTSGRKKKTPKKGGQVPSYTLLGKKGERKEEKRKQSQFTPRRKASSCAKGEGLLIHQGKKKKGRGAFFHRDQLLGERNGSP